MKSLSIASILAILANGLVGGANAATIHKWVDQNGVTHYSDHAPDLPVNAVTRIKIDEQGRALGAPQSTTENYYSIANQWQRINQERLQRQQLELQRAAARTAVQVERQPARHEYDPYAGRVVFVDSRRSYRRHGYKHGRHWLHDKRPGGQYYRRSRPSTAFPSVK
jgi:hypothetical protein